MRGASPITVSNSSLAELPRSVGIPNYPRADLRRSIVHIGVGGFHRAHLATYVHELCTAGHMEWGIVGAGILPADSAMADALATQDCLYTLISRGAEYTTVDVIGSIVDYIHASQSTEALVETIAQPATQLVSLTVTEGGYPVDDLDGTYLPKSPSAGPGSAFGVLASGLQRRLEQGGRGLTVISCDNVVENGKAARTATLGEARSMSDELAEWIADSVTFPNSMVDRITPATTDADRLWLAEEIGIIDRWPVVAEPFRQWVVEDTFAGDRPPLEELDVVTTTDVTPYEAMKLRMLNAAHSCLAYLASLDGQVTVDGALREPALHSFTSSFLDREARPALPPVAGVDLEEYGASLIARFSNPNIGDQIERLCLDGSAKFPKFLLPTVRSQLESGGPIQLSALALAGWCEYLTGPQEGLAPDPMLDTAVRYAHRSLSDGAMFLEFQEVFGADLPRSERFVSAFTEALRLLRERGVRSAVEEILTS